LGEFGFEIVRRHNAKGMHTRSGVAELAQGPDLYEFVHNRPISRFDLFGLQNNGMPTAPPRQDDPEGPAGDPNDPGDFFTHWANDPLSTIGYIGSRPFVWIYNLINSCPSNPTPPFPHAPPQVGCSICPVNNAPVLSN